MVIEFCARWYSPSQKLNPIFEKSESLQYDGHFFYRVDIDIQLPSYKWAPMPVFRKYALYFGYVLVNSRSLCSRCLSKERDLLKELIIAVGLFHDSDSPIMTLHFPFFGFGVALSQINAHLQTVLENHSWTQRDWQHEVSIQCPSNNLVYAWYMVLRAYITVHSKINNVEVPKIIFKMSTCQHQ